MQTRPSESRSRRWRVATPNRRMRVSKPLRNGQHRQTQEDAASPGSLSFLRPHMADRYSREVGKTDDDMESLATTLPRLEKLKPGDVCELNSCNTTVASRRYPSAVCTLQFGDTLIPERSSAGCNACLTEAPDVTGLSASSRPW